MDSELEKGVHHSKWIWTYTILYNSVLGDTTSEWVKCNTYGACKGNPGQISYGFIIRDKRG